MKCKVCGSEISPYYKFCDKCGSNNFNNIDDFIDYERIRNYHGKFDLMTGEDFEQYCCIILKEIGFSTVNLTPRSGDHGIDILANILSCEYAIQCKRTNELVGVSVIRETFAGKHIYKSDVALVICSSEFTEQAKEEAEMLGVRIWDRSHVSYMTDKFYLKKI